MNFKSLNRIFPSDAGLIKAIGHSIKTIGEKQDETPMDVFIKSSYDRRHNTVISRTVYSNGSKKHRRDREIINQFFIYAYIRYTLCFLIWNFAFILGWFALPKLIQKIINDEELKVVKYFYIKDEKID